MILLDCKDNIGWNEDENVICIYFTTISFIFLIIHKLLLLRDFKYLYFMKNQYFKKIYIKIF